ICVICDLFFTFGAFELAGLQKSYEFAGFSYDCYRADPVSLHQLLRVSESRVWLDEKPWRDGAHDVARARKVPALARQSLQIFQRQHPMKTTVLCDWKSDLPVQGQNRVDQVTDEHIGLNG